MEWLVFVNKCYTQSYHYKTSIYIVHKTISITRLIANTTIGQNTQAYKTTASRMSR